MKKHIALVNGIIFSAIMLLIPFTGAFADSDPGIAGQVFNSAFSWYTGFPLVDSSGYLDINDWTVTYRSNGIDSTSSAGSGDVIYLYQTGDFIEYSFQQYDLLSSYITPVWFLQFGQNPYYSSGGLTELKYTLYQSYTSSVSSYTYIRPFTYDNRMIDWTHVLFTYPGTGITKIRIEFDGTPAIWNCIYMKFSGYRTATDAITQADLYQLQAQITTSLNVARLADIVQMDSSDIDLSTLEATTASILQKLSNVPDIIQYIDQLETIDSNILSAVNTFYQYYYDQFQFNFSAIPGLKFYNKDFQQVTAGYYVPVNESFYLTFNTGTDYFNCLKITLFTPDNILTDVSISYKYIPASSTTFDDSYMKNCYIENFFYNNGSYNFNTYNAYFLNNSNNNLVVIKITPINHRVYFYTTNAYNSYAHKAYNKSWYDRIEYYIKQLLGLNYTVPSDVQQTTDEINQNATAVNDFQSSTQQSLDQDLQNVPVVEYQIQATTGTQYMKAYSEALFDASNGFRIWYMLPLILFVIGMLIRWGVKK